MKQIDCVISFLTIFNAPCMCQHSMWRLLYENFWELNGTLFAWCDKICPGIDEDHDDDDAFVHDLSSWIILDTN